MEQNLPPLRVEVAGDIAEKFRKAAQLLTEQGKKNCSANSLINEILEMIDVVEIFVEKKVLLNRNGKMVQFAKRENFFTKIGL